MVGARGFEPPTSRSQTERTTRLCYAPKKLGILRGGVEMVKGSPSQHQRAGAMADAVLNFVGEFGEGLIVAVGDEERVVAETTSAARFEDDGSVADAVRNIQDFTIGRGDCHCCDETRVSIGTIYFREFGEK